MTSSSTPLFSAPAVKWPALAAGALLALSGCAVSNSEAAPASGSALRVVLAQEPPTLEACESNLTSTGVVVRSNVTEPLVERNPKTGELEPLLATEWKATSATGWTFKLREGVKFQDGTPFNAEAAAFTIDRAVNSKLGCNVEGYVFGDAELKVKAVDATTLTVTTPKPDPILPLRLSFLEVVPHEGHEEGDDAPADHDPCQPHLCAELLHHHVAGEFEDGVGDEEQTGAEAVGGGADAHVGFEVLMGIADVGPVQLVAYEHDQHDGQNTLEKLLRGVCHVRDSGVYRLPG